MFDNKQIEKMNNCIIDLKLKLDRANCNLSALLDLNNMQDSRKQILDQEIVLITSAEHKKLNDLAVEYINNLTNVIARVYNEINKKEETIDGKENSN